MVRCGISRRRDGDRVISLTLRPKKHQTLSFRLQTRAIRLLHLYNPLGCRVDQTEAIVIHRHSRAFVRTVPYISEHESSYMNTRASTVSFDSFATVHYNGKHLSLAAHMSFRSIESAFPKGVFFLNAMQWIHLRHSCALRYDRDRVARFRNTRLFGPLR
jgi:hypothetical protein